MVTVAQLVERLSAEPGYEWQTREQRAALDSTESASRLPTRKITAVGAAGALTAVLVFVAGLFGIVVDPATASSATLVLSILAGYVVKD